jgi:asparagine synthase (glutamine-hydrolysing)
MCGICGFITPTPLPGGIPLSEQCRRMADTMYRRGPDSGDVWSDDEAGVALGHRRLAIIDLSPAGSQPMENGDLIISYNGEIYNFNELRLELETLGHSFRGGSDTEVLLAAVSQWGAAEAVKRCIGMFAFAIWNKQDRSLTLVRDRLGIKPLYYGQVGKALVFASELKPFLAFPGFQAEIDRNSLAAYFRFTCVPAPHAIFKGVHKLGPGEILYAKEGEAPRIERYWSLHQSVEAGLASPFMGSMEEAVSTLDRLLNDAVKRRMIADVPLGAFLSGGIDSSLVAALMQSNAAQPVRTFSIGFKEQRYNEAPYAKAVAEHLGTRHTELYVDSRMLLDTIPDIPLFWDEPFADSSQIPTYLLSKLTREHVTVCLSGDGGDELFLGYERYQITRQLWKRLQLIPAHLRAGAAAVIKAIPAGLFNFLGRQSRNYKWRIDGIKINDFQEFYRFILSSNHAPATLVPGSVEALTSHFDAPAALDDDLYRQMAYIDTTNYLPDDILTKVDRASMAASLETRVPILDHRVVEFAASLPTNMLQGELGGKTVLKKVLSRYVPNTLFERPKAGFTLPVEEWLGTTLRDWCEDLLSEESIRKSGYLDPAFVSRMWREYLAGRTTWHSCLWSVLMFQSWLKKWQ